MVRIERRIDVCESRFFDGFVLPAAYNFVVLVNIYSEIMNNIDIFEDTAINDDDFEAVLAVVLADDGDVLEDGEYTLDCPDCQGG